MNAEPVAPLGFAERKPPLEGWSFPRWIFFLALAVAAHFALIFLFSAKKTEPPRTVANAPQFHLAVSGGQFTTLTDPTLFARPHESVDFVPANWRRPPSFPQTGIRWTEPPQFLQPAGQNLGAAFNAFMQTNQPTMQNLNIKPEPQSEPSTAVIESALPQNSALKIVGGLAQRQLLNQVNVPSIPCNDVLPPCNLQVLVDAGGTVISAVELESSDLVAADQKALELARTLRFAPAEKTALGEIIFIWHTVPTNAP
jgi:hypothetical protein